MIRVIFVCLLLIAVFTPAIKAQDVPPEDEQIFSRLSEKTLEKLLKDANCKFERQAIKKRAGGEVAAYIVTFSNGYKASLFHGGTFLSLWSSGFKTMSGEDISLERVNEWNKKNALFSSHVAKNGDGVMTAGLSILDGTNHKIIIGWLKDFAFTVPKFAEYTR